MTGRYNRLIHEKSPYLLQHRHNPVYWYAWGEEAFRAAREAGKPIFLSIGYATCHWCHVMERESFESFEVAEALNRDFIAIKVDREERPDVDEIYMSAVHAMGQRGGWPLSVFLTPELHPFFGGTYWPREAFLRVLAEISRLWIQEPRKVRDSSAALLRYLRSSRWGQTGQPLTENLFERFYQASCRSFDPRWGGFGPAPKFPHSMQLGLLLRLARRFRWPQALPMVTHTLECMARGGIYDQIGFGFSRYSTDERWQVPHFEKMLYDNALLAVTYLEAFQATHKEEFARVAREVLDYALRTMTHPEGGFYSAEDADSEGEEGKFYVWTFEELREILTEDEFEGLCSFYAVEPGGNFEGGANVLSLRDSAALSDKDGPLLRAANQKLLNAREGRVRPLLDDKILTSWNGLMIRAMALGYQVLGEPIYFEAASRAAAFIRRRLETAEGLQARYRDGEARFSARLEDYAYLIQALLELYACRFETEPLRWALRLQNEQNQKFWDGQEGGFFLTDGLDPSLIVRSKEGMDGAMPNANAVSVCNLLRLHGLMDCDDFYQKASHTLRYFSAAMAEHPTAFSQMLIAYDSLPEHSGELAIIAAPADGVADVFFKTWRKNFYPHVVVACAAAGDDFPGLVRGRALLDGRTTFYLCRGRSCEAPTHHPEEVLRSDVVSKTLS